MANHIDVDIILQQAEECVQKVGLTKGTWYVARTVSKSNPLNGFFILVPDASGDRLVMININDCDTHLAHMTLFEDILIIGVVREGKASKQIWD